MDFMNQVFSTKDNMFKWGWIYYISQGDEKEKELEKESDEKGKEKDTEKEK